MKQNKFFFGRAKHIATLLAVLALVLFVPAAMSNSTAISVTLYVLIVLLLLGGCILLYAAHRNKGERVNYFLYDHRRDSVIPKEELSFELINESVELYLSKYVDHVVDLWTEIPKRLFIQLDGDTAFRPLIAYRMLYELSDRAPEEILACFEEADLRMVGYLCRSIKEGGDRDMANYIYELKRYIEREGKHVPAFFRKNRRCFEERMFRYVERNMSDFYMDKKRVIKQFANDK